MTIHCTRVNETLEVEQVRTRERELNEVTSASDTMTKPMIKTLITKQIHECISSKRFNESNKLEVKIFVQNKDTH
jgi:nickel-dependent lactate racemase